VSMCNWTPRHVALSLDFPGKGPYTAEIYSDAPDADRFPKRVLIERKRVTRTASLKAQLSSAGGYAVRLRPDR